MEGQTTKNRAHFIATNMAGLKETNLKSGFEFTSIIQVNSSKYTYKQFDGHLINHYNIEVANRKPKAYKSINQSQYTLMLNIKLIYLRKFYFVIKTKDQNRYKKLNNQTIKKATHKKSCC